MEAIRAGATHGAPPLLHLDRRAKTEILVAILLALFLGALDQTIVGVALPTIATKLGGAELYAWSITIYLLTSTITGPEPVLLMREIPLRTYTRAEAPADGDDPGRPATRHGADRPLPAAD